jgi:hypothetical protein
VLALPPTIGRLGFDHSNTRTSDASGISFSRASEQIRLVSVWVAAGNKGFPQGGKLLRSVVASQLHNLGSSKLVASFVIRVADMASEPLPGDTVAGVGFFKLPP